MTETPTKNLPRVFISHSNVDNLFLEKLSSDLVKLYDEDSIWYDKEKLKGGHKWWKEIIAELSSREIFIIVITKDSMDSKWVNDEIDIAWYQKNTSGKKIVPILLSSTSNIRLDLKTINQVRFDSKPYETALEELKDVINGFVLGRVVTVSKGDYDERAQNLLRFDGADISTIYLNIGKNTLQGFQDPQTFELLGFNWGEVDVYTENDRSHFNIINPLTKVSESKKIRLRYANGSEANEVFLIWDDGKKHHIPDPYTLEKIGGSAVETVDYNTFKSLPFGKPIRSMFDINTQNLVIDTMKEYLKKEN